MKASDSSITAVPGIRIGHVHDEDALTGCTVILPERCAQIGVDVRGSAPGTCEIEAVRTVRLVPCAHAILLTGGSAFGLDAASGVRRWLEEQGVGFDTGVVRVPIVPAAVIFDLGVGNPAVRPTAEWGYRACEASSREENHQGRVGAGMGATVGKVLGQERAMWGGLGMAAEVVGEVTVGALAVVNALGSVVDPSSGRVLAGPRGEDGTPLDAARVLRGQVVFPFPTNTTLTVVATDAALTREQATKIAQMAQDGLARAIHPAHTMLDGDIVFTLSVGDKQLDVNALGTVAADLVAEAIVRAVCVSNGEG